MATTVHVPESLPFDSQGVSSQRPSDYVLEATQLSQPAYSQTQNTQNISSQVEPRRKYWAILIPTTNKHAMLKIPWSKSSLQIGRGPQSVAGNDQVLEEKRISNRHCRFTLGIPTGNSSQSLIQAWKDGEGEPEVWLEDLASSNGTFVNGQRIRSRVLLQHGDEISLGHVATLENHDVRYIFRSVGAKGMKLGRDSSRLNRVGEVYERYQMLGSLGKGTFAEVFKAVRISDGKFWAIKQIVKHRFQDNPKTMALFQREISICQTLRHENICRLDEYIEDPQHICLVLEYVDGGDLLDYIMNWPSDVGGGLPESHAALLTLQICRAMAYTHSCNVAHRDLKPENILITTDKVSGQPIIKIADFGLAKMVDAQTMLASMVGTPQYLAPEVVMQSNQNPGYENVVDCWSVGIIVYSMLTKALPFDEDANLPVDKRIKARFTQQFDVNLLHELRVSDLAIDFIAKLLEKRPSKRMTMADALEHPWLAGPSSQESVTDFRETQSQQVWDIQDEFDDDASPQRYSGDDDFHWRRPATMSGTNLESGFDSSDASFSQPMGKLRLATPGTPAQCDPDSPNLGPKVTQNPAPSSPPTTPMKPDRRMSICTPSGMPEHEARSLPTPAPSAILASLKRKAPNETPVEPEQLFSSGSLSPAPSLEESSPAKRSKTEKLTSGRKAAATGISPRRSTRARKSVKI
ncbi:kinase-like domain-containing protein [Papiliotrema laurentii]|uniref:Kinase-like domain-containing protein n=1 Tax=Papiliotrema laurentii TaxID=5418 RepID=A0AAD9CTL3_PAPLA|nr:kinase-like domain-containing protein [Papiliotrema laurentii]